LNEGRINRKTTPMQEILETLGRRMRELREKQGISQEDFAESCGLHRTAVGLLERGKSIPRLDTLLIVSHELGVTVSKLLHGIEECGKLPSKTPY
jgi:transcriptional regulator with XRE-family HTH domain